MRLLFILDRLPYPIHRSGSSQIHYRIIKNLSKNTKVDIIYTEARDVFCENILLEELNQLNSIYFIKNKYLVFKKNINFIYLMLFRGVLFKNNLMIKKIKSLNKRERYNLLFLSPLVMMSELYRIKNIPPIFLNAQDSNANLNKLLYEKRGGLKNKLKYVYYYQFERKILKSASCINFISSEDKQYVEKISGLKNIENIGLGIDVNKFYERIHIKKEKKSIMFSGNFEYNANFDTAKYIIENISSYLYNIDSEVKFYLVGKNSQELNHAIENVIITGYVDDMAEWYNKAEIFFCPLLYGAGIKNKILEAMACGLPVIANSVSISGINGLKNGEHFILADSREDQIKAIQLLLEDESLRYALSQNSLKFIDKYFTWSDIIEKYYEVMKRIMYKRM